MNSITFLFYLLLFVFFQSALSAQATLEFSEIWQKIDQSSALQKSKYLEWKAAEISKDRAEGHWLPKLYTDLRSFQTNDPALNFFSKLGQRSAVDSDFSTASSRLRPSNFLDSNNQPYSTLNPNTLNLLAPDTLNNPGSNQYNRGVLGMDLPLYEGGSGQTLSKLQEKRASGLKWEWESTRERQFAEVAKLYRALQTWNEYSLKLEEFLKKEKKWQSSYQLSNKGNPVGYAGYLSLKSIQNKIQVLQKMVESQKDGIRQQLLSMSPELSLDFKTREVELSNFLDQNLPLPDNSNQLSLSTKAMQKFSEAESLRSQAEGAKVLPRIGLYTEANAYHGSRNMATSYNAGLYLQMNLYNPKDREVKEEAEMLAESFRKKVEDRIQKESAFFTSSLAREKQIKDSWKLLKENTETMDEQIQNTERLFSSGAVTAVQLAESLNRALDQAEALAGTEIEWLINRSELHAFIVERKEQ